MKRIFTTLLFAMVAVTTWAYSFEVDGIYYNILSSTDKTVEVTYKTTSYDSYSGSVILPETVTHSGTTYSVTSIGNGAFNSCTGLTSVTNLATTPQTIKSNSFSTYGTLYVCKGCKEAYQNTDYWKEFKQIIEIDPSGIKAVEQDNKPKTIYNLSGMKAKDADKGVMIIDGKKYIRK